MFIHSPKSKVQRLFGKVDFGHWTLDLGLSFMRQTRPVKVKDIQIGGGAPVVVQSMTKTDTADVDGTVAQIEEMVRADARL